MAEKLYVTYNDVHKLCQEKADQILTHLRPQLMIAIGGGGFIPARILRSFLKRPGSPNIPIQAIGLSLYEALPAHETEDDVACRQHPDPSETARAEVTRTQWLDFSSLGGMEKLVGKRILIVDEVDDTRTTLKYAVKELQKDVEDISRSMGYTGKPTQFSIFVLHNKEKEKKGLLPPDLAAERYIAARNVPDVWICYPWEATDISWHDEMAEECRRRSTG